MISKILYTAFIMLGFSVIFFFLWNWIIVSVFHMMPLTYTQSIGMVLFLEIVGEILAHRVQAEKSND